VSIAERPVPVTGSFGSFGRGGYECPSTPMCEWEVDAAALGGLMIEAGGILVHHLGAEEVSEEPGARAAVLNMTGSPARQGLSRAPPNSTVHRPVAD
jgi:hypothetical protein